MNEKQHDHDLNIVTHFWKIQHSNHVLDCLTEKRHVWGRKWSGDWVIPVFIFLVNAR